MSTRHGMVTAVALVVAIALGVGCRGDEGAGGVRETDADDQRRAGMLVLADSQVLQALRAPPAPGRIIYDPPTDLSLTNARRTRPDLVRGDTTRRDTSRTATRRDTTGGDAAADTSGGAARPRRP